jgi:predicted transposase/invertase (TIGR01784 family)
MADFIFNRYIPFTTDYGFKATFGNEQNTLFLKRALEAILSPHYPIEEIFFDKHQIEGLTQSSRGGVLDLCCRDSTGNMFMVEMQMGIYRQMVQRLKFYAFHKMDTFIKRGDFEFSGLPQFYAIGILGFNLLEGDDFLSVSYLQDLQGRRIDDRLTIILIELEKFNKTSELCLTDLDKLIFTMKEAHHISEGLKQPSFMEEDWLKLALERLNAGGLTPEQRSDLSILVMQEMNERNRIKEVEKEGIKQGTETTKREDILNLIR